MKDGFFRTAAATLKGRVADTRYNCREICRIIEEGEREGAGLMVFPELCITSYTCNDLFLQEALLRQARAGLKEIVDFTEGKQMVAVVGLPWEYGGRIFNVAAFVCGGRLLGLVPKLNLPNYGEFYEQRYFAVGMEEPVEVSWEGEKIPMGTRLLFACREIPSLVIAAEICEDLWVPCPPSIGHVLAGATVILPAMRWLERIPIGDP